MERYFQVSFHALMLAGFVAMGRTGRLDLISVVAFAICFVGSTNQAFRNRPPLVGTRGAFWLPLAYIAFFPIDGIALSRSFVPAVIHMILFLVGIKLAQQKRDKDYFHLILLSFLLVLAASSLTIDMSFVFVLVLYVGALISTLMSFEIHRSERSTPGSAAPGNGLRLTSMSVWATGWIVIIGVAVFFLVPRFGTGYFTRAGINSVLLSGFSGSVELGEIGRVKLSSNLVMRTRLTSGVPLAAPKWRGVALDSFDGKRWYTSAGGRTPITAIGGDLHTIQTDIPRGNPMEWEIFLEPLATPALFAPHVLNTVIGAFPGLEIDGNESVFMQSPTDRRIRYEVLSYSPSRTPLDLPDAPAPSDGEDLERHLQVPNTLDPRVQELAQTITSRGNSVFEKASLIELYLKRNYEYSLDLDWDPGAEPLTTFLFDARRGHCEYFASSMAIMLRSIGIPTRLVNGFLPGEFNSIGRSYIVRQSDAHSWVEVWIPGQGWIEFDPTPPDPGNDFNMTLLVSHYVDAFELFWNSYILTYDSGTQSLLLRSFREAAGRLSGIFGGGFVQTMTRVEGASDALFAAIERMLATATFWVVLMSGVLTGLIVRYRSLLRIRLKFLRLRLGLTSHDADIVSALFRHTAALAGCETLRKPHQTWREWTSNLPEGPQRRLMTTALGVFEKSQYSPEPVTDEEFLLLEQTLEAMRHSV